MKSFVGMISRISKIFKKNAVIILIILWFLQFFICKSSVTPRLDIGKHILLYIHTYLHRFEIKFHKSSSSSTKYVPCINFILNHVSAVGFEIVYVCIQPLGDVVFRLFTILRLSNANFRLSN